MNWLSQINNWVTSHSNSFSAWASLIAIISLPLVFIGLVVGLYQVRDILILPDPSLEFVHPSSVGYRVINKAGRVAEDVVVAFGIFDLDSPQQGPVPISSVNYDYVNKNSAKGPFLLFPKFATTAHRYFGIAYICCKGGKQLRTYWIYVKQGYPDEGFYAERNDKVPRPRVSLDTHLGDTIPRKELRYVQGHKTIERSSAGSGASASERSGQRTACR